MEFRAIEMEDIPRESLRGARGKIIRTLEAFIDANCEAAELLWLPAEYKNAKIVRSVYADAVKREHLNISIVRRGERVFMIKGDK